MNPSSANAWGPSPEILAAYADGELEGRDDLVLLRQRVESWLLAHPEAQAHVADLRRLHRLCQQAAPPEPAAATWNAMLLRIDAARNQPGPVSARSRWPRVAGWVAASVACIGLAASLWWQPRNHGPLNGTSAKVSHDEEETFVVAQSSEVEILRVEGEDIHTLVVGQLPVKGSLELVSEGDVTLVAQQGGVDLVGPRTPMIWARLDWDDDE